MKSKEEEIAEICGLFSVAIKGNDRRIEFDGTALAEEIYKWHHSQFQQAGEEVDTNKISDGYHTFGELYEFRKVYNAALFNEWASNGLYGVHKSKRHFDGEECFGGGWFIVVAILPTGQISNHYEIKDWDLFKCVAEEKVFVEFDGHTSEDVINRIKQLYPS